MRGLCGGLALRVRCLVELGLMGVHSPLVLAGARWLAVGGADGSCTTTRNLYALYVLCCNAPPFPRRL